MKKLLVVILFVSISFNFAVMASDRLIPAETENPSANNLDYDQLVMFPYLYKGKVISFKGMVQSLGDAIVQAEDWKQPKRAYVWVEGLPIKPIYAFFDQSKFDEIEVGDNVYWSGSPLGSNLSQKTTGGFYMSVPVFMADKAEILSKQ